MTTLLSELRNDALSAKLFPALFVGGLTGGLLLIESLVLANVIFVGPLSPYVSNGIGMLLLGYAAFCVLVALTSGQRGMMACPQGVSAAVLATTAVTLTRVMDGAGGGSPVHEHGRRADPVDHDHEPSVSRPRSLATRQSAPLRALSGGTRSARRGGVGCCVRPPCR